MRQTDFQTIHFTGEGFRTLAIYRLFVRRAIREIAKWRADYEAEVAEWYENGEGRPAEWVLASTQHWFNPEYDAPTRQVNIGGLGHTFPHCIHGSSRWTDYDNICGGCEDPDTDLQNAIIRAREQFLRFNARWEWVNDAPGDLAYTTRRELMEWATSIFPKTTTKENNR